MPPLSPFLPIIPRGAFLGMPIAANINVLGSLRSVPMPALWCNDWKEIAEAARNEQDPEKLIRLVRELNKILEEQQMRKGLSPAQTDLTES
jgi:hypothetical protein